MEIIVFRNTVMFNKTYIEKVEHLAQVELRNEELEKYYT